MDAFIYRVDEDRHIKVARVFVDRKGVCNAEFYDGVHEADEAFVNDIIDKGFTSYGGMAITADKGEQLVQELMENLQSGRYRTFARAEFNQESSFQKQLRKSRAALGVRLLKDITKFESISRLISGELEPSPGQANLVAALSEIVERLQIVRSSKEIRAWFVEPSQYLGWRTPSELFLSDTPFTLQAALWVTGLGGREPFQSEGQALGKGGGDVAQ